VKNPDQVSWPQNHRGHSFLWIQDPCFTAGKAPGVPASSRKYAKFFKLFQEIWNFNHSKTEKQKGILERIVVTDEDQIFRQEMNEDMGLFRMIK
jgi:hypothetical protein